MDMKYVAVYENWLHFIRRMSTGEEVADFFQAVFKYMNEKAEPQNLSDLGQMAFGFVRPFLDESVEKWNRKSAVNKRNGLKGAKIRWDAERARKDEILAEIE